MGLYLGPCQDLEPSQGQDSYTEVKSLHHMLRRFVDMCGSEAAWCARFQRLFPREKPVPMDCVEDITVWNEEENEILKTKAANELAASNKVGVV